MSISSLAHAFAKTYYTRLSQNPELVYRFYGKDSTVSHGIEGRTTDDAATSRGQTEIKAQFAEEQYSEMAFLIRDVASVPTAQNCVLVTVLGELAHKESEPQQFSQTFVLARTNENALYILTDVRRILHADLDAEVQPATGAVDEARQLVEGLTLKETEFQGEDATAEPVAKVNPNSWASVLAKPQPQPPTPKAAPRVSAASPAAPANAGPPAAGQYSAFLKLSSSTAITKPLVIKALAPFGPISNLQLDAPKRRGYVDFPEKRMFDRALKTARVKVPGGRETIEILKRFSGPPHQSKTNSAAAVNGAKGARQGHSTK